MVLASHGEANMVSSPTALQQVERAYQPARELLELALRQDELRRRAEPAPLPRLAVGSHEESLAAHRQRASVAEQQRKPRRHTIEGDRVQEHAAARAVA